MRLKEQEFDLNSDNIRRMIKTLLNDHDQNFFIPREFVQLYISVSIL